MKAQSHRFGQWRRWPLVALPFLGAVLGSLPVFSQSPTAQAQGTNTLYL